MDSDYSVKSFDLLISVHGESEEFEHQDQDYLQFAFIRRDIQKPYFDLIND